MTEKESNGPTSDLKFDPDDPECQKQMRRPPDIDQDMKEMERRKRVEMIMNSQVFREELERIIESQLNEGYLPASLSALQQVTELLLPHSARNSTLTRLGHCGMPINDIRGIDGFRYAKGEKLLRCKLAAVYRLVDLYGWSEGIYNHITTRVSQDHEHFLLNPFGLQYHEVTASSLLKVDMQGNIIDPGSTNFSFNRAGFVLHSAIHTARPDIKAIIHLHYPACVAVSAMKCGLLPASQEAAIIGDISYHDYKGLLVEPEERKLIGSNLGPFNKVLVLKNHGVVTCGESIEEALFLMQNVVLACETQIKLINVGLENVQLMSDEAIEQVRSIIKTAGSQVQGKPADESFANSSAPDDERVTERPKKWKIWDLEFESQMRMLDNAGFRTGYLYRQPLLRADQPRTRYDVEAPPSALGYHLDEDKWLSPLKKLVEGKRTQDKLRWVNSPNVYQKVEILETGTTDPKKITKWVQDGNSPAHSTPIKIENLHQFVPVHADVNEFKKKQKAMKEIRFKNEVTSGPQSHILEGVPWEDISNLQQQQKSGDHIVHVGAASKGIIQREFQHNATVYKAAYAKNPFDNVTDQELEEYKQYIERKQRGESTDDVPDHFKHLLIEPVSSQDITSPTSPLSDDGRKSLKSKKSSKEPQIIITPSPDAHKSLSNRNVQRSHSARLAAQAAEDNYFSRNQRFRSERKPKKHISDTAVNGEDKVGDLSGASRSSKEGSPIKDSSISEKSSKKEKDKDKKKKGIRTPSFLKKKKHKKDKEKEHEKHET